jgi:hypothetical protein
LPVRPAHRMAYAPGALLEVRKRAYSLFHI